LLDRGVQRQQLVTAGLLDARHHLDREGLALVGEVLDFRRGLPRASSSLNDKAPAASLGIGAVNVVVGGERGQISELVLVGHCSSVSCCGRYDLCYLWLTLG